MHCLPKIDQPCPLERSTQRRLAGFCQHCDKTVHVLDGMSPDQRRALLRGASGPICVSYRVAAGLGAALALALAAAPNANAAPDASSSQAPQPLQTQGVASAGPLGDAFDAAGPAGPQSPLKPPAETAPECDEEDEELTIIMVGGITRPGDAPFLELENPLTELPMREAPQHFRRD